jgi:hypothetical protein
LGATVSKVIDLKKYKRKQLIKRLKERMYLSGTPGQTFVNVGVLIVLMAWFVLFFGIALYRIMEVLTK